MDKILIDGYSEVGLPELKGGLDCLARHIAAYEDIRTAREEERKKLGAIEDAGGAAAALLYECGELTESTYNMALARVADAAECLVSLLRGRA